MSAVLTPAPAPAAAEPPGTGDRHRLTVTAGLAVDVVHPGDEPDARRIDTVVCRMRFRAGARTAGAA
ncbi:hypothetical protein [Streptosporangium minutum]|uniref:Uncharacterized protein n=1 Tax=Streptosporangium minutum TaxID=569862 RepID=A0A243RWM1_9ACTN|nr:hypothetical protein [Streptosporangium minutum]OUC99580.1 hypothetical protein CA984_02480 [Streptosporangium minutum]